jgi:hypothetical protein
MVDDKEIFHQAMNERIFSLQMVIDALDQHYANDKITDDYGKAVIKQDILRRLYYIEKRTHIKE